MFSGAILKGKLYFSSSEKNFPNRCYSNVILLTLNRYLSTGINKVVTHNNNAVSYAWCLMSNERCRIAPIVIVRLAIFGHQALKG